MANKDGSQNWPAETWQTASPEEVGMDSRSLLGLLDFITQEKKNVHSLLVVSNGLLVFEAYSAPYRLETKHHLASATKSVLSLLVGAAIHQGVIRGVDQKIIEFFPEMRNASVDPVKKEITIEHLLTMTAGIRWQESARSYWNIHSSFVQMIQQKDWTKFVLAQPLAAKPGEKFIYSSGLSHLLSAILQKETGITAAEYAQEHLFRPLGITDFYWESDPKGITTGGWGLQLTPQDMARLGYLCLRNGVWEDETILPAAWVAESTREHLHIVSSTDLRYQIWRGIYRLFRRELPFMSYGYGYHWGIPAFGGYAARGIGGQAIFVLPAFDLVVVITGGLPEREQLLPEKLVEQYILPAARSSMTQAPDGQAQRALGAALQEYAQPEPKPVPPHPETAAFVSSKKYDLQANVFGIQSLSFTFPPGSEAGLEIGQNDEVYPLAVGLDGVYRINRIGDQEPIALKGGWTSEDTFTIDLLSIPSGRQYEQYYTFHGDTVKYNSRGVVEGIVWRMVGRIEE